MKKKHITQLSAQAAPQINNDLTAPVRITARARAEIIATLSANKIPDTYGLRVGLRGGGCGASFLLGFDLPADGDQLYQLDGIRVIIDRRHLMYVLGAKIDHEDDGQQAGFTIIGSSTQSPTEN